MNFTEENGLTISKHWNTQELAARMMLNVFFSLMRDVIGQNFTTKEVKLGMRKIISQFVKRVDPDLPFYYHSSTHTHFYPEFDKNPDKEPKEKRLPRREQPAAFVPRRATMSVRGSLAVRPKFHNLPLELPPPPNEPVFLHEHSYARSSTINATNNQVNK